MREIRNGKHLLNRFESIADLVKYSESVGDHRTESIKSGHDPEWYNGKKFVDPSHEYHVDSLDKAHAIARQGLGQYAVKAMSGAMLALENSERDIARDDLRSRYDVSGSEVDVTRYLEGEPENMVEYYWEQDAKPEPVATIVVSVACHCGIDGEAMIKHGNAIMELMVAVEDAGTQTEIWIDSHQSGGGKTARQAVCVKHAGGALDVSELMYAIAHPALFRAVMLNAMHGYPETWQSAIGVGWGYGRPSYEPREMDDYPEGAVWIAGAGHQRPQQVVDKALKDLGLAR